MTLTQNEKEKEIQVNITYMNGACLQTSIRFSLAREKKWSNEKSSGDLRRSYVKFDKFQ